MKKIIRIEDITEIVGMKNYIEALSLNQEDLNYLGCDVGQNRINFNFRYDSNIIKISVDKKNNIKELKCNCLENNLNYCKHIALALMYIMTNNMIEENLERLNSSYDEEFNKLLFKSLNNKESNVKLKLEVILKESDGYYELKLKIGENSTYMLNRNIREFFSAYHDQTGYVEFGKKFIYNPNKHYFSDEDKEIIEFVSLYVDSQLPRYGYYNYYDAISKIMLTDNNLKKILTLLKNKNFTVEKGYYNYYFNGINNFDIDINIKNVDDNIKIDFDYNDYTNLTKDYIYLMTKDKIFNLTNEESKLIKLLIENNKKQIILKNNDLGLFSNLIFPIIKNKSKLEMDKELKHKFVSKKLGVKYYFDYNKNNIVCNIKLSYNDILIDINDLNNNFNGIYICRDRKEEKNYIKEITDIGFLYDVNHNNYYLIEDKIVDFLEKNLNDISLRYETYISKNIKKTNIIKKLNITNTFKLGKDNILKYNFNIDNIDTKEISNILISMKEKKKYYKLKNGDFLYLQDNKLEQLDDIFSNLNINSKNIKERDIELPIYKSLFLKDVISDDFVTVDNSIKEILNKFNQYKNSDIILNEDDKNVLRDYQYIGVKWMNIISKCGFGGILADEMGLGKSIQTINYLKMNKGKTLIVVPTSLIYNWENEFKKFGKELKFKIVIGTKSERMDIISKIDSCDILITSYGLLRNDCDEYLNYEFQNLIIDEAQNIKNVTSDTTKAVKKIKAKTKFALTGTPIENSIMELWSIIDFVMPNFFPPINEFRKIYNTKDIKNNDVLDSLNKKISPFILRRKKKDVLKDLPDKIENNIMIDLNDKQKKLYLAELERTKEEINKLKEKNEINKSSFLILSLLTKLRQICIDPRLVFESDIESSKLETLVDILNNVKEDHKILLFSQFPSALKLIIPKLKKNNISYYYLDGSTKSEERINLVNKFNNDNTNVFLISLKAGGTGLNLTSADIVIHYDPWWNPQVENQATDRSHRIGQKNVVEVIKLIAKGTIEEKIIDLQLKKQELSDKIIEGENRDTIEISNISDKELEELLL